VFSAHYCSSNPEAVLQFVKGNDTVLLLAFATVLLNTDLHNNSIRPEHKMTLDQFIHNLRGYTAVSCVDVKHLIVNAVFTVCRGRVRGLEPPIGRSIFSNSQLHLQTTQTVFSTSLKKIIAQPAQHGLSVV